MSRNEISNEEYIPPSNTISEEGIEEKFDEKSIAPIAPISRIINSSDDADCGYQPSKLN